jgi:hypothetical protein
MEEDLIITIWDLFVEYVPEKNREMAANQYIDFLLGHDVTVNTLESLTGYDDHLDKAIENLSEKDEDDDHHNDYED